MKKYMIIFFILLLQGAASAQYSGLYGENLNQNSNRLQGKLTGEVFYLSLIGNANHFLQSDWVEGTITLKDGDVFEGVRMRYMAYGDELVAYNSNIHALFIVDKNTVKQFTIKTPLSSGSFAERKFINLDSLDVFLGRTYFEELYSGTVKFLVFYQIEERKISPFIDRSGKMSDTEFQLKTIYYILTNVNGFNRIQLKNRSIFTLFPENKREVRKLFRINKINIVNENSAIQAFELLDAHGFLK